MSSFKKILVAIDLDESAAQVLAQAGQLAAGSGAGLCILHVGYSTIPVYGGFIGEGAYINNSAITDEASIRAEVLPKIQALAKDQGLTSAGILVEFGRTVDTILDVAADQGADLIVVGSHGRHGVGVLLGSTANGVLHRAKCDVMAVRIGK